MKILLAKETRAGELRVGLIPGDIKQLINHGHSIFVEHNAGKSAGFEDVEYQNAGAQIIFLKDESIESYKHFFQNMDVVVRAKRPAREREILENQAMKSGTILIGALDPLEKNAKHLDEYRHAGIVGYSIDQLELDINDPMNVLAAMSQMAGRLALLDGIEKFGAGAKKIVIIGFGVVGQSAFKEAFNHDGVVTVILSNKDQAKEVEGLGAKAILLNRDFTIEQQQELVKDVILDADVVITGARKANQPAPLLIPLKTLRSMKKGSVIVDMALSEGGNVEGSEHDETKVLGNEIIVTNTSGYPKAVPHEASILWSRANLHFINMLAEGKKIPLQVC